MNTSLFEIFKVFFIIGIQLLGGGYVIVPLLKKYISDERGWMSEEEIADFFALSQCMPGIIAGNISVCAGYKARGISGAAAALFGIILPCIISIVILAEILTSLADYPIVQNAFKGIRASAAVLIILTVKELRRTSLNSVFTYLLAAAILAALFFTPVHPACAMLFAGVFALLYGRAAEKQNGEIYKQ